jgi:hypothetical protein
MARPTPPASSHKHKWRRAKSPHDRNFMCLDEQEDFSLMQLPPSRSPFPQIVIEWDDGENASPGAAPDHAMRVTTPAPFRPEADPHLPRSIPKKEEDLSPCPQHPLPSPPDVVINPSNRRKRPLASPIPHTISRKKARPHPPSEIPSSSPCKSSPPVLVKAKASSAKAVRRRPELVSARVLFPSSSPPAQKRVTPVVGHLIRSEMVPKSLLLPLILVETPDVAVHHVVVLFCVLLVLLVARSELTLPTQLNRFNQVVRCRVDRMVGAVGRHLIMQAHNAG